MITVATAHIDAGYSYRQVKNIMQRQGLRKCSTSDVKRWVDAEHTRQANAMVGKVISFGDIEDQNRGRIQGTFTPLPETVPGLDIREWSGKS